jgi:hypothetical protein
MLPGALARLILLGVLVRLLASGCGVWVARSPTLSLCLVRLRARVHRLHVYACCLLRNPPSAACIRWQSCTDMLTGCTRRKHHGPPLLGSVVTWCAAFEIPTIRPLIILLALALLFASCCLVSSHTASCSWCACAPFLVWCDWSPHVVAVVALGRPLH